MNTPQTGIQLDTRRETKNGYPVKLRVTYLRKSRLYDVGIKMTKADFAKLNSNLNVRGKLKDGKIKLATIESKAITIIDDLGEEFTFSRFKENLSSRPKQSDVITMFEVYIDNLKSQNRIGTAISYTNALNSIKTYIGNHRLEFHSVTPEWLDKYQVYMLNKGKSLTTVGIYTRSLRTIFNIAIDEEIIDAKYYPFGKRRFQVPAPVNTKKALTRDQLKKIFNYTPEPGGPLETALDYWKFSYLCNGANPADIFRLKHSNITDDTITFIREKTKRSTVQNLKNITAARTLEIDAILGRRSTSEGKPYLFEVLDGSETPDKEKTKISQAIKTTNKWMRCITKELGADQQITFMTARHSFATMLKRGAAPTEFIQESLGHKSLATTENYLDSFENITKKKYASILTDF
ncbi:MAG: site-specific integrase [Cyclobacteriaceae bacterium]